jgi:hypothetical protein
MLTHVSATLNGLTAIRAFGAQAHVMRTYHACANVHTAAFATTLSTARWFAGCIDLIVDMYIACVAFICVFMGPGTVSG